MNLEQHTTPITVKRIFEHYTAHRKNEHRPHLGGSQIGNECERALWYQFRWAWSPQFSGRQLRLFETGDREEERIVRNLRDVGVTVWELDPDTGKQVRFEACGGHFALSLDGVGEGFEESSDPHTLEFKTMNAKNFATLKKDGVQKSKPVYWAQMQVGMHLSGLKRAYFIAVCKDNDDIYAERVKYDASESIKLIAKAQRIIDAEKPPARLNDNPAFFKCKFCDYQNLCHYEHLAKTNCRTCAHSTAKPDGTWHCADKCGTITYEEQLAGCKNHLFNPNIVPEIWIVHDAGPDFVEYKVNDGRIIRNQNNSDMMHEEWLK